MNIMFYSLLLLLLLIAPINNAAFDLSLPNKHGGAMNLYNCNKDTILDFSLGASTTVNCDSSSCTTTNPQASTVRFLDVTGSQQVYTLQANGTSVYQVSTPSSAATRAQQKALIKLKFASPSGKLLYVGIPFSDAMSTSGAGGMPQLYELNLNSSRDGPLATFKDASSISNFALSGLNFLNLRDYGHFYHIANSASSLTETYILSYFVYGNSKITLSTLPVSTTYNFPEASTYTSDVYSATGDKLCWGSSNEGLFQTHLRESYPLWTAWFAIFFYWIYNLLTQSNQLNCYDKSFENNKWTCWGFFSLHYLGHEEYFTKLSRTTQMLITFSWYGCVLGILYYQIPAGKGPVMILWAAIIATVTGMPFTYGMGYIFLRKIYELTLYKYDTLKQMKGVFNKKDSKMQVLQKAIDDTEQSLYGYYYWYYVLAFTFFVAFWTIGIHEMMMIHRDYYYFMYYWLASMGVAFGLEHLFFDPILTLILGNTSIYRIRGFFYDSKLGQRFKEIEE